MSHKVHPTGFRTGIMYQWRSRWFNDKAAFRKLLKEDTKVREFLIKDLKDSGLEKIDIERTHQALVITFFSSRPGVLIGRGGSGIEEIKKKVKKFITDPLEIKIVVEEIRDPNLRASIIAQSIVDQIERRIGFRRTMKQALERVMQAGAEGIKISLGGRLDGAEIARTEWLARGRIPLNTLRADIDFARKTAHTSFGTVGVKVWVNRGKRFDTDFTVVAETKPEIKGGRR